MEKLIAERERLRKQIEALQNELKGLERAIAVLGADAVGQYGDASAIRERGRKVKGTILSLVENAGPTGINVNGVLDAAKAKGVRLERGTVSSLLSRLKRESILGMTAGKYFVIDQNARVDALIQ